MKKIVLGVIGILLAVVIVAVVVVILNLDRIVKRSVEYYGPQVTKVDVKLDSAHVGLFTGDASIKGLVVGNPPGYKSPHSITLGSAAIGLVPSTLFKSKIVVRTVKVESPEITFEGSLDNNNLTVIEDNAAGQAQKPAQTVTNSVGQQKPEKRFEVDDFLLTGAQVNGTLQFGGREVTVNNLKLPEIHLTNLGTDPQGITASDLTKRIVSEIKRKTIDELKKFGSNVGKDLLKNLGNGNNGTNGTDLNQLKRNLGNLLHKPGTSTTNALTRLSPDDRK